MGSGYRVFTAGEVLTASNVQDYLQNQSVMSFADSTARATSIGTANFEEGMVSYLQDSDTLEVYDGSTWGSIAPATTQGLTLINTTSFSAVSSQSITQFNSTYRNYRVVVSVKMSADGSIFFRMRSGSTDLSSAGAYNYGRIYVGSSSSVALGSDNNTSQTYMNVADVGSWNGIITADFCAPFATDVTSIQFLGSARLNTITAGLTFNNTTSYDGFTFYPSTGNMTGEVSVYGYNK